MNNLNENYNLKQYMQEIVNDKLKIFEELIRWGDQEKQEFAKMLANLEKPFDKNVETTKDKGDRLEKLVEFIVENSFFTVYTRIFILKRMRLMR